MAIRNLRLQNGETIALDEWLTWPLYSTVEIQRASKVNLQAFSYVVGGSVPHSGSLAKRAATESDTNQVIARKINHDEAFVAFSLTYEPFGLNDTLSSAGVSNAIAPMVNATTLRYLQQLLLVSFRVGTRQSKPQARAPLAWFGQGAGPVTFTSGTQLDATLALDMGSGGVPTPQNQRRFPMPIFIQADRKISVDLTTPEGALPGTVADTDKQDVRLRFTLDGIKRRAVG